MGDLRYISTKS